MITITITRFNLFFYNLIRNSEFHHLHDFNGQSVSNQNIITPFCFSSIFPYGAMKNEDCRSIIISSPNKNFISFLHNKIRKLDAKIIHFGEMKFDIINLKLFDLELNPPVKFVSATPVIIRIPQSIYKDYNLDLKHPYRYIFWRPNFPLELFLNQLEVNLKRKYFNYYHKDPQSPLKYNRFVFKKQISQKILIKNMSQTIVATFWEFWIDEINELIRFGLDAGIGERNTLGFGFLNLK